MSDMTEKKTDRFRIVPHTPYVYRIERLYLVEIKKTKESYIDYVTKSKNIILI